MNSVILSALIGAAYAIKSQSASLAQSSASSAIQTAVMDAVDETMPASMEEWGAEYMELLTAHATKIAEETIAQLAIDSPLLEVCEKGENCRAEVDRLLKSTIEEQWRSVLTTLTSMIESVTVQTEEII